MIGHIGINVPDLSAAKAYYDEVMPLVDFEEFFSTAGEFSYCPVNGGRGTFLFVYQAAEDGAHSRHRAGLQHIAFMVKTRSAVDAVHARVVELGAEVLHEPRYFPEYPPPYYATFWLDPFGIMLEAVCHHDRD
ncbi:VOC family protein [Streptosporangium sp. CA-135522]|uniref:VOC family protein n=1 Tax=Streptosporangium sp. CA-135522 TaxID=3240072 RepID=UPI003D8A40E7